MSIITLIIVLAIVGFILWLINTKVPMQPTIKTIINIVVVILVIIWVLKALGVWGAVAAARI